MADYLEIADGEIGSQGENMSGFVGELLFADVNDFTTIAKPTPPFTNPEDMLRITGNHVFPSGKGFVKLGVVYQENAVTWKEQGEVGGKSYKVEGEFFQEGESLKMAYNAAQTKNRKFILLLRSHNTDANGDKIVYQIGNADRAARMAIDFLKEKNVAGKNGYMGKFTCDDNGAVRYEGTITMQP